MFVQNLTNEQQSVLLYLAEQICQADGDEHSSEALIMETLQGQTNEGVVATAIEVSDLASLFDTHQAKTALMLELIAVAYADDDYHEAEQQLIKRYSTVLEIDKTHLEKMTAWVTSQLKLTKISNQLFVEDSAQTATNNNGETDMQSNG